MSAPTISVVVPAYNAERYIEETLRSIFAQTHAPDEVIVVDDGSSDGTASVLAAWRDEIRILRKRNGGAASAHNAGFAEARGEFVARCDSDDLWEPGKLERQVEVLEHHREVDIAMAEARVFGTEERLFIDHTGAAPPPRLGIQDTDTFRRRLYHANMLCASSAIIRRCFQQRVGPFREPLPNEDYEYWVRALKAGGVFYFDPAVLVRYRRHEGNVTNSKVALYRAAHLVHTEHADLVRRGPLRGRGLVARTIAHDLFEIGRLLADEPGQALRAREEFVASLRHWPSPRAFAWALVLSCPDSARHALAGSLVSLKRGLQSAAGSLASG